MKTTTDSKAVIRRNYTAKEQRELVKLAKSLATVKEAAEQLGVPHSTANRWVADHHRGTAESRAKRAEHQRRVRARAKALRVAPAVGEAEIAPGPPLWRGFAMECAGEHAAADGVVLTKEEAGLVMSLVRECLKSSTNLEMVRAAARLALKLLP